MSQFRRTKPENSRKRGFALVATVSLMVLLSLLAVGVLNLASVQIRASENGAAQAQARANARLALQLAIGRLQQYAGPDQRVTASADIVGGGSNPRWIGVWRTVENKELGTPP